MTGMKEGAGEDPFADETESEDSNGIGREDVDGPESEDSEPVEGDMGHSRTQQQPMQIPYKLRRDGVQDGRDRVPLFIQSDTKSAERDALRELEERFDADVSLTDLREAVVIAGLKQLDEVEAQLEEWGYGMTFEE